MELNYGTMMAYTFPDDAPPSYFLDLLMMPQYHAKYNGCNAICAHRSGPSSMIDSSIRVPSAWLLLSDGPGLAWRKYKPNDSDDVFSGPISALFLVLLTAQYSWGFWLLQLFPVLVWRSQFPSAARQTLAR